VTLNTYLSGVIYQAYTSTPLCQLVRARLRPNWAWCCSPENGLFFLSIDVSWRSLRLFDTHNSHRRQQGLACDTTRLYWTRLHTTTT